MKPHKIMINSTQYSTNKAIKKTFIWGIAILCTTFIINPYCALILLGIIQSLTVITIYHLMDIRAFINYCKGENKNKTIDTTKEELCLEKVPEAQSLTELESKIEKFKGTTSEKYYKEFLDIKREFSDNDNLGYIKMGYFKQNGELILCKQNNKAESTSLSRFAGRQNSKTMLCNDNDKTLLHGIY